MPCTEIYELSGFCKGGLHQSTVKFVVVYTHLATQMNIIINSYDDVTAS